jgi:hypothetical protein
MEEIADTKSAMPAVAAATKPAAKPAPPAEAARKTKPDDDATARTKRRDDDDGPRSRQRDDDDDRPKRRGRDDEEDEAPRSRKRDDDDRPKRRGRDDKEDEAPRSRKRDDDDSPKRRGRDDDDRPNRRGRDEDDDAPRSRRDRDEDDDRPRRRGRDDDDDDDRGSRRGRKNKRKGGKGKMIAFIAAGVLLLGGLGFLAYYLFFGGGYDEEMVAFMPSDTTSLNFENIDKQAGIAKFKKIMEKEFNGSPKFALLKSAGLSIDDIKRTLEGNTEKGVNITVVRTKKSVDQGKVTSGADKKDAGGKSYWKVKKGNFGDTFVAFPKDDIMLMVSDEEVMKSTLNKESGKVVINETLQELAKKVGKGDIWHANYNKNSGGGGMQFQGPDADLMKAMASSKGSAMRIDISSGSVDITNYTLYESSEAASKVAEQQKKKFEEEKSKIEEAFKKLPGNLSEAQKNAIKKAFLSTSISSSGSYVERSGSLDLDAFGDDLENAPFGRFF